MFDRDSATLVASVDMAGEGEGSGVGAPFDRIELQVIALARREAANGSRESGRLARKFAHWLGVHAATALANPRLEALRQFVLRVLRSGGRPPASEVERFLAAGFSAVQARALLRSALPSAR